MAIVKAPRATDSPGRCTRWRVILYNPATHKQEWTTIDGSKRDAETYERQQKEKLRTGAYISRTKRMTFEALSALFLKECEKRQRRASTLAGYSTILKCHLLPEFGTREVNTLRREDILKLTNALHEAKRSVQLVARVVRTLRAVLNFALEHELIERNPLQRFRVAGGIDKPKANRGTFTEVDLTNILWVAEEPARTLFSVLALCGLRPGEAYALTWGDVSFKERVLIVRRSWDANAANADGTRGRFYEPKTAAGKRTVALSDFVLDNLERHFHHRAVPSRRNLSDCLVFGNEHGRPLNPANVIKRWWYPTLERVNKITPTPKLDLYSLRHTYASIARNAGASAFVVSQAMGHSKSTLVDQVYAHSLPSGQTELAQQVVDRVYGKQDVRQPLDEPPKAAEVPRVTH
jgi:integrase